MPLDRNIRGCCLLSGVFFFLVQAPAFSVRADSPARIEKEAKDIARQAAVIRTRYLGKKSISAAREAEERYLEGESLYRLKDYARAAIVLFDFVESHPGHSLIPDALFYLGDSLFFGRDVFNARVWFEKYIDATAGVSSARFRNPAISRLLQIVVQLNDYESAGRYVEMLGDSPEDEGRYLKGKFLYFTGDFDGAAQVFRSVSAPLELRLRAAYFAGVSRTRQGRLSDAVAEFERGVQGDTRGATPEEQKLIDLLNLGLGRLYLELDQLEAAMNAYGRVDRYSPWFDMALYENAVVQVRAGNAAEAERLLEMLTIAVPESVHTPHATLLRGNLLLGAGRFEEAQSVFQDMIQAFTPVRDRLDSLLYRESEMPFFLEQLGVRSQDGLEVKGLLPPEAMPHVLQERELKQAFGLSSDLGQVETDVVETERLLALIESVLTGAAEVTAFPMLREGRHRCQGLRNRLAQLVNDLMVQVEKRAADRIPGLSQLAATRKSLSGGVAGLPVTDADFRQREKRAAERYRQLRQDVSRQRIALDGIVSNVVALEKLTTDLRYVSDASKESLAALTDELSRHRQAVQLMRADIDTLGRELEQALLLASSGGTEEQQDAALAQRLFVLAEQQMSLLSEKNDNDAAKMDRALRASAASLQAVVAVMTAIDAEARNRALALTATMAQERENMLRYERELEMLNAEAREVVGAVTLARLGSIRARFHDMLLRSDLGIMDVAWGRKEKHKSNLKDLTRSRLNEIRRLDEQFTGIRGIPVSLEEPASP